MESTIIPLYNTYDSYGGNGLRSQAWSTMPVPDAAGIAVPCEYFVLPGEFELRESKFGSFIVHRETGDIVHLSVTFDNKPVLKAPDGTRFVLEKA